MHVALPGTSYSSYRIGATYPFYQPFSFVTPFGWYIWDFKVVSHRSDKIEERKEKHVFEEKRNFAVFITWNWKKNTYCHTKRRPSPWREGQRRKERRRKKHSSEWLGREPVLWKCRHSYHLPPHSKWVYVWNAIHFWGYWLFSSHFFLSGRKAHGLLLLLR